ncbi:MAG: methyl-accepting chemotaxis protein [Parachlamydia sp.]|nr:MAG: methyl-accepting chemotaxis protein [Parachlamydia sp.]
MLSKLIAGMNYIQGKFTYHQRFWFFFSVFIFLMPIPAYLMYSAHNYLIKNIEWQMAGYQYEPELESLLHRTIETWIYAVPFSTENAHQRQLKEELLEINEKSMQNFLEIKKKIGFNASPPNSLGEGFSTPFVPHIDFNLWRQEWEKLITHPLSSEKEQNAFFSSLTALILAHYTTIEDAYGICCDSTALVNDIGKLLFKTIPQSEILIAKLFQLKFQSSPNSQLNIILILKKLTTILNDVKYVLERIPAGEEKLKESFHAYIRALDEITQLAKTTSFYPSSLYLMQSTRFNFLNMLTASTMLEKNCNKWTLETLKTRLSTDKLKLNLALLYWMVCGLILTVFALTRTFTRHLSKILRHLQKLARGEVELTPDSDSRDEFGQIGLEINHMVESVQDIMYKLQELGKKLQNFTEEIVWSAKEQEETISSQEKSVKEIDLKAQMIVIEAKQLADTMNALSLASKQTSLAKHANQGLERMKEKMPLLMDEISKISQVLQKIEEKVKDTSRLLSFIANISDEADILFLNAAIESESAGEHKPSFTEFTQQIQRFAYHTQKATDEILHIINKVSVTVSAVKLDVRHGLNKISSGAYRLSTVSSQLSDITQHVEKQGAKFENVSLLMQQQAEDAEGIIGALTALLESTKKNSPIIRQLDETILQLATSADQLQQKLHFFFRTHEPPL